MKNSEKREPVTKDKEKRNPMITAAFIAAIGSIIGAAITAYFMMHSAKITSTINSTIPTPDSVVVRMSLTWNDYVQTIEQNGEQVIFDFKTTNCEDLKYYLKRYTELHTAQLEFARRGDLAAAQRQVVQKEWLIREAIDKKCLPIRTFGGKL